MFSILPSVDRVLAMPAVAGLIRDHGRRAVTAAIRTRLGAIRQAIAGGADGVSAALPVTWADVLALSPCPFVAATVGLVAARFGVCDALKKTP